MKTIYGMNAGRSQVAARAAVYSVFAGTTEFRFVGTSPESSAFMLAAFYEEWNHAMWEPRV